MRVLSNFVRKLKQLTYQRGFLGTIRSCFTLTIRHIQNLSPAKRKSLIMKKASIEEFDRKYGVNTNGIISLSKLNITSKNWVYGVRYEPVELIDFDEICKELKIPYNKFIFIDLGSGKGLAILLASALSFKQIIGVEFSEELNRIAKNNISIFPDEVKKCSDIKILCLDACQFIFPDDPFVLYMYNPFEWPVMKQVRDNVVSTFRKHPRRIVVVYFTPRYSYLWDSINFLRKVQSKSHYIIYDTS